MVWVEKGVPMRDLCETGVEIWRTRLRGECSRQETTFDVKIPS